eukprot:m.62764 g.62764  ORF g.62764 m.62764 type:complete len:124 (-) comp15813_c1_seq1:367-738(-)
MLTSTHDVFCVGETDEELKERFMTVIEGRLDVRDKIVVELTKLLTNIRSSTSFFPRYEIIGSSILHVVGATGTVSTTMLDLGKTVKSKQVLKHDLDVSSTPPGSEEEGYLVGLQNLIKVWESL